MSSKISPIYSLTVYPTGNIISAWPESRCKVFSANAADIPGFPVRTVTKSQGSARSVSRPIGTNPVDQTAKRSGDRLCATTSQQWRKESAVSNAAVLSGAYRGYNTTMTTISSPQTMMNTVIRIILKWCVSPPFWRIETLLAKRAIRRWCVTVWERTVGTVHSHNWIHASNFSQSKIYGIFDVFNFSDLAIRGGNLDRD
jgi:hypothetical protein